MARGLAEAVVDENPRQCERRDGLLRFARNDGCALVHACGRDCDGNGGGGRKGGLGSRQAPAERPAIIQ
jgi:hypothetical protein